MIQIKFHAVADIVAIVVVVVVVNSPFIVAATDVFTQLI